MKLFLAVTRDEYELPVFVEDSVRELSEKVGIGKPTLYRHFNGKIKGNKDCLFQTPYKFVRVEVEDD